MIRSGLVDHHIDLPHRFKHLEGALEAGGDQACLAGPELARFTGRGGDADAAFEYMKELLAGFARHIRKIDAPCTGLDPVRLLL